MSDLPATIRASIRDGVARAVTAVGLAGIGVIHLLDAPGKFSETPYLAWMYVGLIAASLLTAFALVRGSDRRAWAAAAALAAGAMIGYTLTRTTGLPQATGDIGNWKEPLGMASLFVEGAVVAVSASVLADRRHDVERALNALATEPARARSSVAA
jgi:hypothetical protein